MKKTTRLLLASLLVMLICTVFGAVGFVSAETDATTPGESTLPETVEWDYTDPFVYDSLHKSVHLVTEFDPALYRVEYSNNKAYNAATYTAHAYVYDVVTGDELKVYDQQWTILPCEFDFAAIPWNYSADIVYNGLNKQVELVLPELLDPAWVTYSGNVAHLAGEYTATAKLSIPAENTNFVVRENDTNDLTWAIAKADYDMSGVTFEDQLFTHDGNPHSIAVGGELPSGVSVSYDVTDVVESGIYEVTASFTVADENNYNTPADMKAHICIAYPSYEFPAGAEEPVVIVSRVDGIDPSLALSVNSKAHNYVSGISVDDKFFSVINAYEIGFRQNGEHTYYSGDFTVKIRVPEKYLEAEEIYVIHIFDNGKMELLDTAAVTRDGDYVVFDTTDFSVFALAVPGAPLVNFVPEDMGPMTYVLLGILVVLIIIALIIFLVKRRRGDDDTDPVDTDETPEDDTPEDDNDTPEDETEEETPAPEDEPKEDETEEPKDEVVEEEEKPEEPEEDKPEEDKPVEDEPVRDEPEEVEEKTEEPVPVPPVEEKKIPVVGDDVVLVRYRSSFQSRLIQADEDIQSYYSAIKNKLLSYKGVKARTSWNFESFNKTRVQCAKLNIKGKALLLYINLDTEQYNAGKYHFQNVSDTPKFADVPMMLKVKSERGLKYAFELIEELMTKLEIPAGAEQNVDYRVPFETNEALAERGLVKRIVPKGSVIGDNSSVVSVNVSEMFDKSDEE